MNMNNAIFIGRFQPFHNGHAELIKRGLEHFDEVTVLIGSSNVARNIKNPFSGFERQRMIQKWAEIDLGNAGGRVQTRLLDDSADETSWIDAVNQIASITKSNSIIGHEKDGSSFYLHCFPGLKLRTFSLQGSEQTLSAVTLRESMFSGAPVEMMRGVVPESVYQYLRSWRKTDEFAKLLNEYNFVNAYKKSWAAAPYDPTFVTVDAVVVQSGHVLLVKRRANPGAGLWALPGGFVNQQERLKDAAIRELCEETLIDASIPQQQLRRSITSSEVFDDPNRSLRGRTITHAYLFRLLDDKALPPVKGSDDATEAKWCRIGEIDPTMMYEDHYFIIQEMLRRA